jgi:hypothetical protein
MAGAKMVGIFDTPEEAEAARQQLAAGAIDAGQIAVFTSSLRGTWTSRGYVRYCTAAERGGSYLTVVQGDLAETAETAEILRSSGAIRVDSVNVLVREFLLATPARSGG